VPVIVWVIGGSVLAVLIVCGLLAFMITHAVTNVARTGNSAIATLEASLQDWQSSSLFYNMLELGDYEGARDFLSADLKREYPADRLQQEWESLVDGAGGITLDASRPTSNDKVWVQTLKGNGNNKTYTIRLTVGDDFAIAGADPALIPEP
jgi:hypothetical protein